LNSNPNSNQGDVALQPKVDVKRFFHLLLASITWAIVATIVVALIVMALPFVRVALVGTEYSVELGMVTVCYATLASLVAMVTGIAAAEVGCCTRLPDDALIAILADPGHIDRVAQALIDDEFVGGDNLTCALRL
jgi:hypothetical protein